MRVILFLLLLKCVDGYAQEVKRFRVPNISITNNVGGISREEQRWEPDVVLAKPKNPTLIIYRKNLKISVFSGQLENHYSVIRIMDKEFFKKENEVRQTFICIDGKGVKCTAAISQYITTGDFIDVEIAYGNVKYTYSVIDED